MPRAQQLILLGWVVEGLVLIGLGTLVGRLFRLTARGLEEDLRALWIGWAGLLCGLQVWHLFLPVDATASALAAILGGAGLAVSGPSPWMRRLRSARRHPVLVVAGAAAAIWLSNLSMANPQFGDAGSYHIPLLRWVSEFPIVPGLGNLFFPLGYAQSYFLSLACLNVGPFASHPYHLANGIFLLALAARALLGIARLARRGGDGTIADLFYVLCLPAIAEWGAGIFLTTPSPDLAVFALGLVISGELIPFLIRPREPMAPGRLDALALLAAAAVTVKISIAGLSLTALAVAIGAWWLGEQARRPAAVGLLLRMAALTAIALVPWIARQMLLTGCPFYPSRLAAIPVDWQVTTDVVATMRGHNHTITINELSLLWRNFPLWMRRLSDTGWTRPDTLSLVGLAAAAAAIAVAGGVARAIRKGQPSTGRLPMLALAPTAISFVVCFFGASVPRFFGATLWLVPVQLLLIGVGDWPVRRRGVRVAALAVIVAALGVQVREMASVRRRWEGFEFFAREATASVRLASGLTVNVPVAHQLCWDAPLPCTPEPHRALRLRRPGDLRSGFMMDPALR